MQPRGIFYRTRPATAISKKPSEAKAVTPEAGTWQDFSSVDSLGPGHNKFIIRTSPDGTTAVWQEPQGAKRGCNACFRDGRPLRAPFCAVPRTGSTNITAGAIFGHSNVGHILSQPLTRPASAGKQVWIFPALAELRHDICQKYRAYWEKLLEDPDKKVTGLQSDIAVFQRSVVFGYSLDISDTF